MFKVLVCGGRDFTNTSLLVSSLNWLHHERPIELVIHGMAKGADLLAQTWAISHDIAYLGVPARWTALGKAAGHERNARMLNDFKPDYVVAFPGGAGTAGMIALAKQANLPVWEVRPYS